MKIKLFPARSRWMRLKELLVTTPVGWIPTIGLGVVLRNLLYRHIFKRMGSSVFIQDGAEFLGASSIEIGDRVHIFRGVRIDGRSQNSRIWLGYEVSLQLGVDISAGENCSIEIGERTFIGPYSCVGGPGHVKIGKDCLIAAHSGIIANNHNFADPLQKIRDQGVTRKGIVIEDDCWLGYGVKVLDGVTIGQGSVIGAGAVVTKDIPPYSVAVGVPARVVSRRLPISVSATLAEVEKTAELSHQHLQTFSDTEPAHLVFEKLLQALLNCIRQVMAVDTVAVLLRSESGQQLTVRATLGLEEEIAEGIRIPIGRGFAGNIAASRKLTIVEDLSKVEIVSPILRNKGLRSMVGIPLLVEDRVIGVFHIGTIRSRQFTRDDVRLLQLVGDYIELAVDRLEILRSAP
jgi:acetyltransferase-like isoleucine patch superfamily enzyme